MTKQLAQGEEPCLAASAGLADVLAELELIKVSARLHLWLRQRLHL